MSAPVAAGRRTLSPSAAAGPGVSSDAMSASGSGGAGSGGAARCATPQTSRHRTGMAWTGLGLAVAMLLTLALGGPLRAPAALAFACFGPGAAVLAHLRVRDPVVAWTLALLVSVCGYTTTATALAWSGWWHPRATAVVAGVLVAAAAAAALARPRPNGVPRPAHRPGGDPRGSAAHGAVLAAAVVLWLIALARTDLSGVGMFGLAATVFPTFFVAVALCAAGFTVALTRRSRPRWAPAAYLVLLILIIHGTVPLLLDQPQYAWTYKHLGVVEYIRATGTVGLPDDIYQQWPGLFAAAAQLTELAGVPGAVLADWSAVFFNFADALVLFAIARTLGGGRRVAYLTTFGFVCVNWVEEDYLSPQALAFLLSLGALLVLLRWLRPDGCPRRVRLTALAGFLAISAVATLTHQLSPYLLLAQVSALAVLRRVRPWWTPLPLGAIVLAYLVPRYNLVAGGFDLFDGFDIFANAAGNAGAWGSVGQAFSAIVVRLLALSVWGLTAAAVWRARHRLGDVLVPATLAATPFSLLLAQSYGGEAIYRVFLFSAPWCVYLISVVLVAPALAGTPTATGTATAAPHGDRPGNRRRAVTAVALGVVLTLAALATVQGRHGQLMVDRRTTAEVAAAGHLYTEAATGATIALATPNFPSRPTADYPRFNQGLPVGEPDLVIGAELRDTNLGPEQLPAIEGYLEGFGGTTSYLVVSDAMRRQAEYFGYLPDGALDRLEATLQTAPRWSVWYRNDEVTIYQLTG